MKIGEANTAPSPPQAGDGISKPDTVALSLPPTHRRSRSLSDPLPTNRSTLPDSASPGSAARRKSASALSQLGERGPDRAGQRGQPPLGGASTREPERSPDEASEDASTGVSGEFPTSDTAWPSADATSARSESENGESAARSALPSSGPPSSADAARDPSGLPELVSALRQGLGDRLSPTSTQGPADPSPIFTITESSQDGDGDGDGDGNGNGNGRISVKNSSTHSANASGEATTISLESQGVVVDPQRWQEILTEMGPNPYVELEMPEGAKWELGAELGKLFNTDGFELALAPLDPSRPGPSAAVEHTGQVAGPSTPRGVAPREPVARSPHHGYGGLLTVPSAPSVGRHPRQTYEGSSEGSARSATSLQTSFSVIHGARAGVPPSLDTPATSELWHVGRCMPEIPDVARDTSYFAILGNAVKLRAWRVLLGHAGQQFFATGLTSLAREAIGVGLQNSVLQVPLAKSRLFLVPIVAIALASVAANHWLSRRRVAQHQEAAARAAHGFSQSQWDKLTQSDRDKLMQWQVQQLKTTFILECIGQATHLAKALYGASAGDKALIAEAFATQFKIPIYAGLRDGIQATFVGTDYTGATHGVDKPGIGTAQWAYLGATLILGLGNDFARALAVPDSKAAVGRLAGAKKGIFARPAVQWMVRQTISSGFTWATEVHDFFVLGLEEAKVANVKQEKNFHLTGNDYPRLFDHTVTRIAHLDLVFGLSSVLSATISRMPLPVSAIYASIIVNMFTACVTAYAYRSVVTTWQAQAAGRSEHKARVDGESRPPRMADDGA
jgi:hypothetical protein